MSNYYNKSSKQIVTRALMDAMGLPASNSALVELGYYPMRYDYLDYDQRTQQMLPDGTPKYEKSSGCYVQKFQIVDLGEAEIAAHLERCKAEKLEELNTAWLEAEQTGTVESAAGFVIDANERANRDIQGLIIAMDATGQETASFCAADNSFHEVTLEQLKTMQLEIITYGQRLYALKWQKRMAIQTAASFDEVDAVELGFAG